MGRSYHIFNPGADAVHVAMMDMSGMTVEQRAALAREYLESGRYKLFAGNIAGAVLDLSVSIEADATDPFAFIYRGEAFLQISDLDRAEADFTRALELDDGNPVALYDRAMVNIRREVFASAIKDLDVALVSNRTRRTDILSDRDILSRRAQLHLWMKNFQAAAADYTAAIAASGLIINPDDLAGRAEAYTGLQAWSPAARDYLAAITIISERIQDATTDDERENMSRMAMSYFEKSAALHVLLHDFVAARADLESAIMIGTALGDDDAVTRMRSLLEGM